MMTTITRVDVVDVRFTTSLTVDGSDAMNKHTEYSAAYVIPAPSVFVKSSGLPAEVPAGRLEPAEFRPWLLTALEAFGSDRAMTGSDWPVSAHGAGGVAPEKWFDMVDSLAVSEAERDDLGWRTAAGFYGIASG